MAINTGVIRVQVVDADGNEREESEVKLKFTADTSELNRELDKTDGRVRRLVDDTNRGLQVAVNLNRLTGGVAGAAAGAALTRPGRRVVGGLARTAVQVGVGAGAVNVGRAAVAGVGSAGLAALAAPIAAIIAIAAGVVALVQIGRASSRAAEKQAKILSGILIQSTKTGTDIATLQAQQRRQQDPFQRGVGVQRARISALGVGITASQIQASSRLQNATNELDESREALSRTVSLFAGPLKTFSADVRATFNRGINNALQGAQKVFGVDQTVGKTRFVDRGGGFVNATTAFTRDLLRFTSVATIALNAARGTLRASFTGRDARDPALNIDPRQTGPLGGANQRNLARLQFQGPQQILTPSPTVRAGGESEYQFRVQRQRFALQQEITRRWQDRVIRLLTILANDAEGGVSVEDLFISNLQFGRDRGVE